MRPSLLATSVNAYRGALASDEPTKRADRERGGVVLVLACGGTDDRLQRIHVYTSSGNHKY